jgi:hypothetical protein
MESTFFYTEEDQNPIPYEFFSEGVLITSDWLLFQKYNNILNVQQ